ncbi:site-specific integrase [Sulfobacillus sp. DSM 109850]|uniref:Site-specific integrase n=1 Tax=Sulfobacillus harzensis TaxID=2729629 RepID=A0A7Y0L5M0_9FIRM|nr:site-specific integrase [Sulfobacillus harzensis]
MRRGPYTVRNQTGCLQTFQTFLSSQHPEASTWTVEDALTLSQCRAFMATLAKRGLRPKTLKGYVIALRGLIRFLHDEEVLPDDWSMKLQGPRVTERRADPLTQEEATLLKRHTRLNPGATPRPLVFPTAVGYRLAAQRDHLAGPAGHPLGPAAPHDPPWQEGQGPDDSIDGGPVPATTSLY